MGRTGLRSEAAADPEDAADDVDGGGGAIGPAGISGIVAEDRDTAAGGADRQTLDEQSAFEAEDVEPVAQAPGAVAPIDEDLVAVGEGRRHRIALDADQSGGGRRDAETAEPGR